MAQTIVLAYGNRKEDILDAKNDVIGYRIWTGPDGEETLENSLCAHVRQVEFLCNDYPGIKPLPQDDCERTNEEYWDAWKIIQEITDEPDPYGEEPAPPQKQSAPRKPTTKK